MKPIRAILLLLAIMAMLMTACAKKAVETQPVAPEPTPQAQPAPPAVQPSGPSAAEQAKAQALDKFLNELVYFDFDSAVLRPDAQAVLRDKVLFIDNYPEVNAVIIEGHCDERGTDAYNMALGARRADSVKQFMVKSGIAADKLDTISYGEERPVDPGHNEAAWSKNRRGVFVLAK